VNRPNTKQEQPEHRLGEEEYYDQDFIPDESQEEEETVEDTHDPADDALAILNNPFAMDKSA
jgi:hypothetical protein